MSWPTNVQHRYPAFSSDKLVPWYGVFPSIFLLIAFSTNVPTAMVLQNSIGSESDFEELVSVTSSIEPLDINMPASEPMDQRLSSLSLTAESGDDHSQSPADGEYPHHEKFYFDDGSITFVVRSAHSVFLVW